jgi:ribosomal protein S18 acetylase RimI-like enzyme
MENFLHNKAITFEKKLRARTYLLIDTPLLQVAGYFSVAISILYASKIDKETLLKIGDLPEVKDIPCLLIGQLAKSDNFKNLKIGNELLDLAICKLEEANQIVGGRFILVDALNNEKVINFYKENGFFEIEKIDNKKPSIKMIRPFY